MTFNTANSDPDVVVAVAVAGAVAPSLASPLVAPRWFAGVDTVAGSVG